MEEQELLDNLLLRLDSDRDAWQIVTAREVSTWPPQVFAALCHEGLLAETAPATTYPCTDCDEDHDEEVIVLEEPPGSTPRMYISCPSVGRIRVNPEQLRQWRLLPEGLVQIVARLLGLPGPYTELVPGRAWSLGVSNLNGVNREALMLRGLSWEGGSSILESLSSRMASVPSMVISFREAESIAYSFPLTRVLRLVDECFVLDNAMLDLIIASWKTAMPATDSGESEQAFEHSDNYKWIRWQNREYTLSKRRAQVVRMLHEAYRARRPVLSWEQITCRLDTYPERMSDIFKKSPVWGTLVIEVGQGLYRLDL